MYSRFFSFKKSYFSPLSRFLLCHLNDPDSIILNNATDWLKGYSNFHKGKYFEERLENLAQLTSIAFIFFYYGSQWCQTTVWFQSFLCVQQKKETHTGLQQLEGE